MAFDPQKWNSIAATRDAAGVALSATIAIDRLADAIEASMAGDDDIARTRLAEARRKSQELFERFVEMTGWTPDNDS